MQNDEGPEKLHPTDTIAYNTKVTFQAPLSQKGIQKIKIYPIDWQKSTIDIQSPVRTISNPLYLIADPILDMNILKITLKDEQGIHTIDQSQVQRKYQKVPIDTYRQNVYIPMDDMELTRVKKELFP